MVLMGRTAHADLFARPTAKDREVTAHMLDRLGIAPLAQRPYTVIPITRYAPPTAPISCAAASLARTGAADPDA